MKKQKNNVKIINNYEVFAFIDSQNINLGTRKSGWELDFKKFRTYLRTKYNVKKAFLFIGYVEENTSLYSFLQEVGYIIIFKPTMKYKKNGKETHKGNVDAELVLHAMINFDKYNKAIIASGDGDFYCLIEYLEKNKKLLKVMTPNTKFSSLLRNYSNYILQLNQLEKKLGRK